MPKYCLRDCVTKRRRVLKKSSYTDMDLSIRSTTLFVDLDQVLLPDFDV